MSATRDSSQPITFVFTSLHDIYRKGLDAARSAEVAPVGRVEARADLDHPRFGAEAPAGQEKFFALRSETYRVIKPAKSDAAPIRKAALRSSERVLKAGERAMQVRPHEPVRFLRTRVRKTPAPAVAPATPVESISRIELADASRLKAFQGVSRMRETLSRLDRLQSRLHFLLREIKDYSDEGSDS